MGRTLLYHYSDFVSRAATPDPPHGVSAEVNADGESRSINGAPVPPSICVCQPTEISMHVRSRWEVSKEFVDQEGLILGDAGWFPGALGHRFTFEAKASSIQRFVHLKRVPEPRLIYLESTDIRGCGEERQRAPQGPVRWKDALEKIGWNIDSDDESTKKKTMASRRRERAIHEYNEYRSEAYEDLEAKRAVMLPALLNPNMLKPRLRR